jgi:hypothetical protein
MMYNLFCCLFLSFSFLLFFSEILLYMYTVIIVVIVVFYFFYKTKSNILNKQHDLIFPIIYLFTFHKNVSIKCILIFTYMIKKDFSLYLVYSVRYRIIVLFLNVAFCFSKVKHPYITLSYS